MDKKLQIDLSRYLKSLKLLAKREKQQKYKLKKIDAELKSAALKERNVTRDAARVSSYCDILQNKIEQLDSQKSSSIQKEQEDRDKLFNLEHRLSCQLSEVKAKIESFASTIQRKERNGESTLQKLANLNKNIIICHSRWRNLWPFLHSSLIAEAATLTANNEHAVLYALIGEWRTLRAAIVCIKDISIEIFNNRDIFEWLNVQLKAPFSKFHESVRIKLKENEAQLRALSDDIAAIESSRVQVRTILQDLCGALKSDVDNALSLTASYAHTLVQGPATVHHARSVAASAMHNILRSGSEDTDPMATTMNDKNKGSARSYDVPSPSDAHARAFDTQMLSDLSTLAANDDLTTFSCLSLGTLERSSVEPSQTHLYNVNNSILQQLQKKKKVDKLCENLHIELATSGDIMSAKERKELNKRYLRWLHTSLSLNSVEELSKYYSSTYHRQVKPVGTFPPPLPSVEDISTERASVMMSMFECRRAAREMQLAAAVHLEDVIIQQEASKSSIIEQDSTLSHAFRLKDSLINLQETKNVDRKDNANFAYSGITFYPSHPSPLDALEKSNPDIVINSLISDNCSSDEKVETKDLGVVFDDDSNFSDIPSQMAANAPHLSNIWRKRITAALTTINYRAMAAEVAIALKCPQSAGPNYLILKAQEGAAHMKEHLRIAQDKSKLAFQRKIDKPRVDSILPFINNASSSVASILTPSLSLSPSPLAGATFSTSSSIPASSMMPISIEAQLSTSRRNSQLKFLDLENRLNAKRVSVSKASGTPSMGQMQPQDLAAGRKKDGSSSGVSIVAQTASSIGRNRSSVQVGRATVGGQDAVYASRKLRMNKDHGKIERSWQKKKQQGIIEEKESDDDSSDEETSDEDEDEGEETDRFTVMPIAAATIDSIDKNKPFIFSSSIDPWDLTAGRLLFQRTGKLGREVNKAIDVNKIGKKASRYVKKDLSRETVSVSLYWMEEIERIRIVVHRLKGEESFSISISQEDVTEIFAGHAEMDSLTLTLSKNNPAFCLALMTRMKIEIFPQHYAYRLLTKTASKLAPGNGDGDGDGREHGSMLDQAYRQLHVPEIDEDERSVHVLTIRNEKTRDLLFIGIGRPQIRVAEEDPFDFLMFAHPSIPSNSAATESNNSDNSSDSTINRTGVQHSTASSATFLHAITKVGMQALPEPQQPQSMRRKGLKSIFAASLAAQKIKGNTIYNASPTVTIVDASSHSNGGSSVHFAEKDAIYSTSTNNDDKLNASSISTKNYSRPTTNNSSNTNSNSNGPDRKLRPSKMRPQSMAYLSPRPPASPAPKPSTSSTPSSASSSSKSSFSSPSPRASIAARSAIVKSSVML